MSTDLKVMSLLCKCVFYRTEHNAKEESHKLNYDGLKMEKWNISIDRAQRVDEKNGVICLIMFTPGVMVINISKMFNFCIFCWLSSFSYFYFPNAI